MLAHIINRWDTHIGNLSCKIWANFKEKIIEIIADDWLISGEIDII